MGHTIGELVLLRLRDTATLLIADVMACGGSRGGLGSGG